MSINQSVPFHSSQTVIGNFHLEALLIQHHLPIRLPPMDFDRLQTCLASDGFALVFTFDGGYVLSFSGEPQPGLINE